MDVEPAGGAGGSGGDKSASPDTGDHGELNSEVEFSEDDDDTPEGRAVAGSHRKPMPSKYILKAARARRARRNDAAAVDNIQDSAVK